MRLGFGGILMLFIVLIVALVKCNSTSGPDRLVMAKADLLRQLPEIECSTANLVSESKEDGPAIYRINGKVSCIDSLRKALEKRGYQRGTRFGEWYLEDGYLWRGQSDPTVIFSFNPNGRSVLWIREYS
jgi:hypothetical protein